MKLMRSYPIWNFAHEELDKDISFIYGCAKNRGPNYPLGYHHPSVSPTKLFSVTVLF
jgi:hypothetical protein